LIDDRSIETLGYTDVVYTSLVCSWTIVV